MGKDRGYDEFASRYQQLDSEARQLVSATIDRLLRDQEKADQSDHQPASDAQV